MTSTSFILLFQWLRWHTLRNTFRVVQEKSLLRMISILLCSIVVWGSLFALCYYGFREIENKRFLRLDEGELIGTVFDIMFATLTGLLIFSTGIILYSSLFSSPEANFLLTTPAPADHVFAYKLQGGIAFSSWAFVLLGSPVLIAYGLVVKGGAAWTYYPALGLFFVGFILIPGSIGGMLAVIVVNIVPKHRNQLIVAVAGIVFIPVAVYIWHWLSAVRGVAFGTRDWFWLLLHEIRPLSNPWMPSQWISRGLQAAAVGNLEQAAYNLTLVWSTGLFLYVTAIWVAGRLYRRGFNRMASGGTLRKRYGGGWLDRLAARALFFLDDQTRLLILKDFRTFRREPAQWFQIFIFFQLTVVYFWGMRSFYEYDMGLRVQNGISLLTLTAISFLACAYTGRFIYPMLSLEGRKFWILGLLPMSRDRLLWGKFAFAAMGTITVTVFLVVFSSLMLNMPWPLVIVHGLTACVVSIALSGVSVGLGACMPNFRENDPSKIALGLGGTLNLVACLMVLVVVIGLMAGPWHLLLHADPQLQGGMPWWIFPSLVAGIAFGASAAFVALRSGIRTLRRMEF